MSKVAIVYWSGTGNTEAMAASVLEGVKEAGAEGTLLTPPEFDASMAASFDAIAFGCPAMGSEVLEEDEFEPMFSACEAALSGKKIALFGSYGWGDGEWMRNWEERLHRRRSGSCVRKRYLQRSSRRRRTGILQGSRKSSRVSKAKQKITVYLLSCDLR